MVNNPLPARRGQRSSDRPARDLLAQALKSISYEVLPFKNTEAQVLAHVPKDVSLTVTTTEAKGLGPTLDLAVRLSEQGYDAAPHLAARLVRDGDHLDDIAARLTEAGVRGIFVVGGDAREPAGRFTDALSLLEELRGRGHSFAQVGIGGYPEGHGHIADEVIERALAGKSPHATQIITQLCFSAPTTAGWARSVKQSGVDLPVRVGIPGAVNRQKLIRISAGLGLGQSARFLQKQQGMFWRFFLPGGYKPNPLVEGVAAHLGLSDNNLHGFHVFTFNELEKTEAWRREWLAALA
ncbi:methylenetetrahydrofolate reductase [Nocardia sp. R6R-6]|uniref:methylenetetrahydrofolate reductase n=1 Tax=Nocardia sp. R6R-6 TaxID=3459303 RepID=UPI00403E1A65